MKIINKMEIWIYFWSMSIGFWILVCGFWIVNRGVWWRKPRRAWILWLKSTLLRIGFYPYHGARVRRAWICTLNLTDDTDDTPFFLIVTRIISKIN